MDISFVWVWMWNFAHDYVNHFKEYNIDSMEKNRQFEVETVNGEIQVSGQVL